MGLAEEIARVRMRARGAEINARHRRSKEKAREIAGRMGATTPIDGVAPPFGLALDAARAKAKAAAAERDAKATAQPPRDRIEQLVREGKLPPRPGDLGVGYEPTPEEILGDLAEPAYPSGTETLPDAASVLAGDAPAASGDWGAAPGASAPEGPLAAAGAPSPAAPLAQPSPAVHSKRKRGK